MKIKRWEILAIAIVAILALVLLYFRPISLPPPSNGGNPSELKIHSFESSVLRPLTDKLELEILDFGVDRNAVVCYGVVHMQEGAPVSGARVGMLMGPGPENSVTVVVHVYTGELVLPNDNLDFNFRNIPILSQGDSFEFSLTCSRR